ncbi:MAG TPA: hypothetical protein VF047_02010 [Nitrososphaeraceae archaeon]
MQWLKKIDRMIIVTIMMIINRIISNKSKQIRITELPFMTSSKLTDTLLKNTY